MIDIKFVRNNPDQLDAALKRRSKEPLAQLILELDKKHRDMQNEFQGLQTRRNAIAKEIGMLKSKGGDITALSQEAELIKQKMAHGEDLSFKNQLDEILMSTPNMPDDDVPNGVTSEENVVVNTVGEIPKFSFSPKLHYEVGANLKMMDFEKSAQMSGARFSILSGPLARLERALSAYMLDVHTNKFGYREISPPLLVNDQAMFGTGQLPKFREDQFQTTTGHWLIPTAEVVLTNLAAGEILEESQLPLRFVAHTPCFRAEAGSAGRDTHGLIRRHQFYKVELVSITTSQNSADEHERMTSAAQTILTDLKLPFRTMLLCAGDMGFSAIKTYDLEVWLPGENNYREISSCSNCGDFQARRMNARYRPQSAAGQKTQLEFVHTLNGSGLAVGRTLVAILENYQLEDGSVRIPDVLVPYMGGVTIIKAGD